MKFTKMNGLGNDFIIICQDEEPDIDVTLVQQMCDRHFGIGADGVVYVLPSVVADAQMKIMNADGSEPEQCGNAIRCVARFLYERMEMKKTSIVIETKAGLQAIQMRLDSERVTAVRVDMGEPTLHGANIPTRSNEERVVDYPLQCEGKEYRITAVSMGNPHAVLFVEDALHYPIEAVGAKLEHHPFFPNKSNIEFISIKKHDEIDMRVWERGVGQTWACGSGACAAVVAGVLNERTARKVTVHLKGGDLLIEWDRESNHVFMEGPAQFVFDGDWLL
ncbi:diaminopimelate epimerase [Mechercharimyces sp. CAU 1602]|uniref:diaminopimelate epimerase n=1 Tax=Mechercharimyces sp. CAU 1602 TaxID=2973933 RepID=UPI00216303FF|nr:diaminopimelate epimerase [Mechercharimyces sp. CAU 1602]MCS1350665.1 diaminopimelate epimerase [Mechercharimyces sp. CAU 1602]